MALSKYYIPYPINVSKLDAPMTVGKGDLSLKKPLPIKVVLFAGVGLTVNVYFSLKALFNWHWGMFSTVMFSLGFLLLIILAFKPQENDDLGYKWWMPTLSYWFDYKGREINTHSYSGGDDVLKLRDALQVNKIDERGVLEFVDGRRGVVYDVIGSGSLSLFGETQTAIIDAYEKFLESLDVGATIVQVSGRTPQDVGVQVNNLKQVLDTNGVRLNGAERDLASLQQRCLEEIVGKHFKSVHQRIIVISNSEEMAGHVASWFESSVRSGLADSVDMLNHDEAVDFLRTLFS